MKNDIQHILKGLLSILIIGLIIFMVAKLFIFLLPVILVVIGIYLVYRIYNEVRRKTNSTRTSSKKVKNEIEEAEILNEKFDK